MILPHAQYKIISPASGSGNVSAAGASGSGRLFTKISLSFYRQSYIIDMQFYHCIVRSGESDDRSRDRCRSVPISQIAQANNRFASLSFSDHSLTLRIER